MKTLHVDLVAKSVAVPRILRQRPADRQARVIKIGQREDPQVGLSVDEFVQQPLGRNN